MKTQLDPYEITRRYLEDHTGSMNKSTMDYVSGLVRSRSFATLARISSHSRTLSNCPRTSKHLMQIEAFFKKNSDFADDAVCTDAALASFERGERLCRITNRRLDYYYGKRDRLDPDLALLITRAERFINKCLGDFDSFFNSIPELIRVTSGATYALSRHDAIPPYRLQRRMDCTPACVPYLSALYRSYGYRAPSIRKTLWNRLELVPKTWKTHRTIACEPTGNIPFQLAFDVWAKNRLRRHGINLSSQVGNQRHAYIGSIDGSFGTIDLSMASDTVAKNAVAWLLPERWYGYLCDVRSPGYKIQGEYNMYAKFSSMGNGATFALETLIFTSFVRAAGSKDGLVYGDDITIEPEYVPSLLKLLRFFGFVPNTDKSYWTGSFRESCGKHYIGGLDVTPFYLRSTDVWDLPNTCHNVNGLRAISDEGRLWEYLRDFIVSENLPLTAPSEDSTSGVHVHPTVAYEKKLIRMRRQILYHKRLVRKNKTVVVDDSRSLALWHHRALSRQDASSPPLRARIALVTDLNFVTEPLITSRYAASRHKYVRKWVGWQLPSDGIRDELYSFSRFIAS